MSVHDVVERPDFARPARRDRAEGHCRPRRSGTSLRASAELSSECLEHLASMLREQQAFRIDQLYQLDAAAPAVTDPARREVDAALRAAARLVLAEIDAALHRIEQGDYGRCRRCDEIMSTERLTALPMSTWCGSCQVDQDLTGGGSDRHPSA